MAESYVKLEDLEDACRICGVSYDSIQGMMKRVSAEDIVKNMPVSDIRILLEEKEQVFATQVWTKNDIIAALRSKNINNPDDDLVNKIEVAAKAYLEDCSDNWERLYAVISGILNGGYAK